MSHSLSRLVHLGPQFWVSTLRRESAMVPFYPLKVRWWFPIVTIALFVTVRPQFAIEYRMSPTPKSAEAGLEEDGHFGAKCGRMW